MKKTDKTIRFSPSLCLTHKCNLDCIYCYQNHFDNARMSIETAKSCIDWIFSHIPIGMTEIEISFIGGEPLLEIDLIKKIVDYVRSNKKDTEYIFYATTNGTLLTTEMKNWLSKNKQCFVLGLSIDGTKQTHDHNRSNSFDKIDFDFFVKTWPNQGVKMTLSDFSLLHLAENVRYVHSLGFKEIGGVNLSEGNFDWSNNNYLKIIVPQLQELVDFYVENDKLRLNQMLNKNISICETKQHPRKKWCGIGNGTNFFDVDGEMYPCPFVTPMTFSKTELEDIKRTDFTNDNNFIDEDCYSNCYIYPICPECAGANYLNSKSFKQRDKRKCQIQKAIALFTADLQAKRIKKDTAIYDNDTLYYTIEAIKNIRNLYYDEIKNLIEN
ncbi:radical SAM protein [Breznakiellaceae bacterium SP9]